MLEEFRKLVQQEEEEERKEQIVLPDSADPNELAEDGKPMTKQLKEIIDMRGELNEEKPTANEIVVRDTDLPASTEKTINSALRDIPKLCDQCYLIDKCPHYQKGATCYFRNQVTVKDNSSLVDLVKMLLEVQAERVLFGRLIEQSEGGYLDQNLSKEMKLLMDLMKDFKDIASPPREELIIKASGPSKPNGGGILSQLFGGGGNTKGDVIDSDEN